MHFGIDYGSKLAGTTVITWDDGNMLYQRLSAKKQDADTMVLDAVREHLPAAVYLDAPLSLPAAYFGKGDDYHYRAGDRRVGAMSPMFLGGLTARAMKLRSEIEALKVEVFETYPGAFVRHHEEIKSVYAKKDKTCIDQVVPLLMEMVPHLAISEPIVSLHALDSLIAWVSGWRHQSGTAELVGKPDEGVIIF